jgi:hypothetical protein
MPSRVRFHARPGFGRSSRVLLAASAFAVAGQQAQAINVYLVASGDPTVDAQVQGILAAHGHTSVIGQFWTQFDGTESMAGIDAVYLQHIGFSFGDMPESGQTFLRDWVRAGGGLVTGAGAVVEAGQGRLTTLGAILPAEPSDFEYFADSLTFEQVVADPILSAGLPSSFTFSAMGARGVDCFPRPDASGFYQTDAASLITYGVVGGSAGAGSVLTIGLDAHAMQYDDATFGQLLVNSLQWAASGDLPAGAEVGAGFGGVADVCAFGGDPFDLTVFVWNYGAAASAPVSVTVDLPPASVATYASATPAPSAVTATQLTFDLPSIPAGGAAQVGITLTAQGAGIASLTATATTAGDADPSNNSATAETTIHGVPSQVHIEMDDAPDLDGGQAVSVTGPVEAIEGTIGTNDVDMYLLRVEDWSAFSASTAQDPVIVGACGGFVATDTSMFLFDATGRGIAFNEDGEDVRAVLPQGSPVYANRADGEVVWLAVSSYDRDAMAGGAQLWADEPWEVTRAPDGPSAGSPVEEWFGANGEGIYRISLTGVTSVELAPGSDLAPGVGLPLCAVVGQGFEASIQVQNHGSVESGPATVTVELPAASLAAYNSAEPPPTSATPTTLTFDVPPIAGGEFAEIEIDLTAQSAGVAGLTATVVAADDTNPANDSSTREVTIEGQTPPPQTFVEMGDAPALDGGQQPAVTGTVVAIEGTLFPNDADMYLLRVDDWSAFSATTLHNAAVISSCANGGPVSDTALFLFDAAGHGIAFNEDGADIRGYLEAGNPLYAGRTDGEMVWLALAGYDFDPASNGGDIWEDGPFDITRGPDGPAAAGAVNGWTGESFEQGTYRIELSGVSGLPACSADVDGSGAVDVFDLLAYLDLWFTADPGADLDGTPGVDVFDLLAYLDGWFAGC